VRASPFIAALPKCASRKLAGMIPATRGDVAPKMTFHKGAAQTSGEQERGDRADLRAENHKDRPKGVTVRGTGGQRDWGRGQGACYDGQTHQCNDKERPEYSCGIDPGLQPVAVRPIEGSIQEVRRKQKNTQRKDNQKKEEPSQHSLSLTKREQEGGGPGIQVTRDQMRKPPRRVR